MANIVKLSICIVGVIIQAFTDIPKDQVNHVSLMKISRKMNGYPEVI